MVGTGLLGCGKGGPPGPAAAPTVLVQQTVTVAGGGGGATVTFAGTSGWSIRITLAAANNTSVPYGFLECRAGTGVYQPPQETASNGHNSVTLTLTQTGTHTLTVFDATNHGGAVAVKVERLS
jgi:hypothetical protein